MAVTGKLCGSGSFAARLIYSWTVKEFSKLPSCEGLTARSEDFHPKGNFEQTAFYLAVHTRKAIGTDETILSFYLLRTEKKGLSTSVLLKVESTFDSPRGKTINRYKRSYSALPPEYRGIPLYRTEKNVLLSKLEDDCLVVSVEVSYGMSVIKRAQGDTEYFGMGCPTVWTVECLLSSFAAGKHSDVVISVEGSDLPAHKFVLAARSKVFAAMLENDMLERNSHRIEISDFEVDTVRQMLRFLYSGRVEGMTEPKALELLRAADKYDMPDLKCFCSSYLRSHMNERNVVKILVAAEMFNVERLREVAIEYFCGNRHAVDAEECASALNGHANLLCDIVKGMCEV